MKSHTLVIFLLLAPAFSCAASDWSLAIATGISPQIGAAYDGSFDFGLSGAAVEVIAQAIQGSFAGEMGVESGVTPIGWQVLFPIRAGFRWGAGSLHVSLLGETAPGFSLTRPVLFMVGLGGLARMDWNLNPGFGLYVSAGARLTLCPDYRVFTGADYTSMDCPLTLGMRWLLAP